jgi:hypothetical protein
MKMATVLGARASGPPEAMRARGPRLEFIHWHPALWPPPGVYTLASGAGGAAGAIAWGGAPQRGAQPQEYEMHDLISPGGASDLKNGGSNPKLIIKRVEENHYAIHV